MASQEGKEQSGGAILLVDTIQISRKSDPYKSVTFKYGGIIIYGRNGEGEWRTENRTQGKSGFVVIMQTDNVKFEKLKKKWKDEPGQVHGIIYREALGESCKDVTVVGEGFSIMDGEFKTNSVVFNPSHGDPYHDNSREMHSVSAKCVKKVVEDWKRAGGNFIAKDYPVEILLSPGNN